MKTLIAISIWFFGVLATASFATSINIISQTHHVWGSNNGDIQSGSYDVQYPGMTDQIPISGSCYGEWSTGHPSYAMSSAGDFGVEAETTADASYDPDEWYSIANASSTYTFTVQAASLELRYWWGGSNWWEWSGKFVLSDITEGTVMEIVCINAIDFGDLPDTDREIVRIDTHDEGPAITMNYAVDPAHLYMLQLKIEAHNDTTTDGHCGGGIGVSVVPEPATLVLLSLGAAFLRKRQCNQS